MVSNELGALGLLLPKVKLDHAISFLEALKRDGFGV